MLISNRIQRSQKKRRYEEYAKNKLEAEKIRELFNPQARHKILNEMKQKKDFNKQYNMMLNMFKIQGGKKKWKL